MSGSSVGRALRLRFEAVRSAELERLRRKLTGLTDTERRMAEAIIADVVGALAMEPVRVLADGFDQPQALEAVARLFDLECHEEGL